MTKNLTRQFMISLVSVGAVGAFLVADASAQRNGGRDRQDSERQAKSVTTM